MYVDQRLNRWNYTRTWVLAVIFGVMSAALMSLLLVPTIRNGALVPVLIGSAIFVTVFGLCVWAGVTNARNFRNADIALDAWFQARMHEESKSGV